MCGPDGAFVFSILYFYFSFIIEKIRDTWVILFYFVIKLNIKVLTILLEIIKNRINDVLFVFDWNWKKSYLKGLEHFILFYFISNDLFI